MVKKSFMTEILQWLADYSGDHNAAAMSIAFASVGVQSQFGDRYPKTIDAVWRCLDLLSKVPDARHGLQVLAERDAHWSIIAPEWDKLYATIKEDISDGSNFYRQSKPMLKSLIEKGDKEYEENWE